MYGLGLAKGLIETGQAKNVLLITAETYSKFIGPGDLNVRTLFGDAAAATLVQATSTETPDRGPSLGPFVYGTDGRGAENLIVAQGGMRQGGPAQNGTDSGNTQNGSPGANLFMNGPEILSFSLRTVPKAVATLLAQCDKSIDDIQWFIFHQANQFMLEHLRAKIKIPPEKSHIAMRHCGNTVSSTIPIALKHAQLDDKLRPGDQVMLVGFGVGYSWAATLLRWAA